jgi:PTH1 family peptidyl-tRNA hydrolase
LGWGIEALFPGLFVLQSYLSLILPDTVKFLKVPFAMYMIVGLGNPGRQYNGTRHNVGFMMVDYLAGKNNLTFTHSKWKALVSKTIIWEESIVLLKPQTYMNLSGTAVVQAAQFYKMQPANIIVIHDDLDMEFARIKIVSGGGDGGHKGIRSIIEQLGTKNFPRVKIGLGRPSSPVLPEKYVLGKFDSEEKEMIEQKMPVVSEGIRISLQQGIATAMTMINRKL